MNYSIVIGIILLLFSIVGSVTIEVYGEEMVKDYIENKDNADYYWNMGKF